MTGESATAQVVAETDLEASAKRHLMLHFSDMKSLTELVKTAGMELD